MYEALSYWCSTVCCVLGADFVERKCAGVACVALSVGYGIGVAVLRSGEVVICPEEC